MMLFAVIFTAVFSMWYANRNQRELIQRAYDKGYLDAIRDEQDVPILLNELESHNLN